MILPCCKSEEYKWCKNEPVVYKDEQERGYCVFHAPAGKKGVSAKEFEKLVFSRIVPGQRCVLTGTVFEDISFEKYDKNNPLPEISFIDATFSGRVDFSGARFNERADFSNATFSEEACFYSARFSGVAVFSDAMFSRKTIFTAVVFSDGYFVRVKFSRNAYFFYAKFSGLARFSNAEFSGEARFSNAEFNGEADFHATTFSGEADFFEATFCGQADFTGGTFNERANFLRATFDSKTVFRGKTFLKGGNLRNININEKIRFDEVDLIEISFMDTDLRMMDFVNCIWPMKKGHDILDDEIMIYEELKNKKGISRFKAFFYSDDKEFGKVETLYRQLKQKYKDDHDEQRASHWHYCEKEMYRKRNLRRRFFGLTALYGLSSGYGEEPVRAFLFLSLLIVVLSFVQGLIGIVPYSGEPIYGIKKINGYFDMDYRAFGALVLNTIQYATFQKVTAFKPASLLGDFIKSLTQIALPVQAALFALAVRNRLRR